MNRETVVNALAKVQQALSTKELLRGLACFCFTDKQVIAFDDSVALRYPFSLGFTVGLRGKVILDFLNNSSAEEVEFSKPLEGQDGENIVKVKLGRSSLNIPAILEDEFLFEPPDYSEVRAEIDLDIDFITSLSDVAISMGSDVSSPWRLGVTAVFSENLAWLYSTDNQSATRAKAELPKFLPKGESITVMFPPRFITLLRGIGVKDKPMFMRVADKWVEAYFESGLKLFSKLLGGNKLDTYEQIFEELSDLPVFQIPEGLGKALGRALVVLPYAKEPVTIFDVEGDWLYVETKSREGHVEDSLTFIDHPQASANINPNLVLRVLDRADDFCIQDNKLMILRSRGYMHIISAAVSDSQEGANG